VTGAIVSITNTTTGQTASVNTNSAGAYMFAFLKPADYVLRLAETSGEDDTSCLILSKYLILENLIWLPISKPDHGPMLCPVELRVAL
jgi:Carboxypeptidase regulatory-like domain